MKEEGVEQPLIYLSKAIDGEECTVVLMGETHIATKEEERAADRVLPYFRYIGCEGVSFEGLIEGRFILWVMDHIILPWHSFFSYREKRSRKNKNSISRAYEYYGSKTKKMIMLEEGWKPNARMRIFFIAIPILLFGSAVSAIMLAIGSIAFVDAYDNEYALAYIVGAMLFFHYADKIPILGGITKYIAKYFLSCLTDSSPSRESNMVKNLITELKEAKIDEIIVLTGSRHTIPIATILKNQYGFVEKRF